MDRGDRQAAAGQLLGDEAADQTLPFRIEIGRGLIEQPQRHDAQRQACERDAAPLSGRERAHQTVGKGFRAHAKQRLGQQRRADAPTVSDPVMQILARGQIGLQRWLVTQVSQRSLEAAQIAPHVGPAPADLAFFRVYQTGQRAQQARLAGTVHPGHLQTLAARERKTNPRAGRAARPATGADFQPREMRWTCWLYGFGAVRRNARLHGARVSQIQQVSATSSAVCEVRRNFTGVRRVATTAHRCAGRWEAQKAQPPAYGTRSCASSA
jgi:hypothetical protein